MNPDNPSKLIVLSDIHYAGAIERTRGNDYEFNIIKGRLTRFLARLYRHYVWMRHPMERGAMLDRFLAEAGPADYVIVNGDHSCNSGFIGLADSAALASATECLDKIKARYGDRAHFVFGDHELGKRTMFSGQGGMRLASWRACTGALGLPRFWKLEIGNYVLMAVCSPLLALPANQADTLPEEWPEWQRLREEHLAEIRTAFDALRPDQRVLLFCHDPTALPFLGQEEAVRRRLPQIECTIIGHLHSNLIIWKSRWLGWIPPISFLGHTVKKMSSALSKSRAWWSFKIKLCPALAGIQLLNDGGYFTMNLDPAARKPAEIVFHPLRR
jgi:hypothetical protein